MKKRVLSLFLAVLMLAGLLPVSALAEGETTYTVHVFSGTATYYDEVTDSEITGTDISVPVGGYVTIDAAAPDEENYEFSRWSSDDADLLSDASFHWASFDMPDHDVYFTATYHYVEPVHIISEVDIVLTEPYTDGALSNGPILGGTTGWYCSLDKWVWFREGEDCTESTFIPGKTYTLQLTLTPYTGNNFSESTMVTLNGGPDRAATMISAGTSDSWLIYLSFDVPAETITSCGIELTPPTAGEKATAEVSYATHALVDTDLDHYWYDDTANVRLTAEDRFTEGHTYSYHAVLIPEEGYFFAQDCEFYWDLNYGEEGSLQVTPASAKALLSAAPILHPLPSPPA